MSKTPWTPWTKGPWTIWDGDIVAQSDACSPIATLYDDTSGADARLIVAAPEMAEALIDVTASLVAAISLLERGGKKAAASDKMFEQMLVDYHGSVKRSRAVLAKARGEQ